MTRILKEDMAYWEAEFKKLCKQLPISDAVSEEQVETEAEKNRQLMVEAIDLKRESIALHLEAKAKATEACNMLAGPIRTYGIKISASFRNVEFTHAQWNSTDFEHDIFSDKTPEEITDECIPATDVIARDLDRDHQEEQKEHWVRRLKLCTTIEAIAKLYTELEETTKMSAEPTMGELAQAVENLEPSNETDS